jgi:hypothetical protein
MKNPLNQKCYVNFRGKNNYTEDHDAGKVEFHSLPDSTYFCMGNVGNEPQSPAGKAMLFCFDGGTCLTPIYDVHGKEIIIPEYAGKELKQGKLQNA